METALKQLIKEAILEALVEFTNGGVATLSTGDPTAPGQAPGQDNSNGSGTGGTGGTTGNGGNNSGQGGGSADNSGGGLNNGRPIPNTGVGVWSRR